MQLMYIFTCTQDNGELGDQSIAILMEGMHTRSLVLSRVWIQTCGEGGTADNLLNH